MFLDSGWHGVSRYLVVGQSENRPSLLGLWHPAETSPNAVPFSPSFGSLESKVFPFLPSSTAPRRRKSTRPSVGHPVRTVHAPIPSERGESAARTVHRSVHRAAEKGCPRRRRTGDTAQPLEVRCFWRVAWFPERVLMRSACGSDQLV